MNFYIHETPGRVRIKIPSIKGKPDRGQEALAVLRSLRGIENATINHLTGSIVINYDPQTTSTEVILHVLGNSGFVAPEITKKQITAVDKSSAMAGEAIGRALFGWAVGRALEGTGLGFIAAFI